MRNSPLALGRQDNVTASPGSIAGRGLSPVAVPSAGAILPRGAISEAALARRAAAFGQTRCGVNRPPLGVQ